MVSNTTKLKKPTSKLSKGRVTHNVVYRNVMTVSCRHDVSCRVGPLRHDTIGST